MIFFDIFQNENFAEAIIIHYIQEIFFVFVYQNLFYLLVLC